MTVAAADANAAEAGLDPGVFTVTRTGATTAALTVNYTVGARQLLGPTIGVVGQCGDSGGVGLGHNHCDADQDTVVEGNETVTVTLSSSASYTAGSPNERQ